VKFNQGRRQKNCNEKKTEK